MNFPHSEIEEICLDQAGLDSLLNYIAASFARDSEGGVSELQKGIYGDSRFYAGVGDFFMTNTCNKWTARGLQSAGLDIAPMFKLTADSVLGYLKNRRMALCKTNAAVQAPSRG